MAISKKQRGLLYDKMPKPASETRKGRERLKKYWMALGRFVDSFAKVEYAVHIVLAHHARLDPARARAMLSGVRASAGADFLRSLGKTRAIRPEEMVQLEPVLAQFGLITNTRNLILHYGTMNIAEGRGVTTDVRTARNPETANRRPISPTVLGRMTFDLEKIFWHLVVHHTGRPALRGEHEDLQRRLQSPWRYKLPQPKKNRSRLGQSQSGKRSKR